MMRCLSDGFLTTGGREETQPASTQPGATCWISRDVEMATGYEQSD